MKLLEVFVREIAIDRETEYPVVLLESEELGDVLPIWIGRAEAAAIYNVLSKKTFKRPMTHDLIR
ncbi:MAG: bifunctional nuclease family protein, partial [Candidatus Krumholzibacteria bacterium]|nr:bifunctional nuclease family protein [Candidatus Krumholzibacteria bacterium]